MSELADYRSDVLPMIDAPDFRAWAPDTRARVLADVEEAKGAFAAGNHGTALDRLRTAVAAADEAVRDHERAFSEAFERAQSAFEADRYEEAALAIDIALQVRPSSEDAAALKAEVERLPEVLAALEAAAIARVENDLSGEAESLRTAVALDPDRTQASSRLETVEGLIRDADFARAVEWGLAAVETRDLKAATRDLSRARSLFPDRPETGLLEVKVAELARELEAEDLIRQAMAASRADDWVTAAAMYGRARQVIPDSKDANDGLQMATTVVGLQTQVRSHLATPHRLASPNVETEATTLLAASLVFTAFSPSLASDVGQLARAIEDYTTPLTVTVVSDGQTRVSVRGVGQIGQTTGRTIELKPGTYTFEGAREGFQSKLVDLTLKPGMSNVVVEVICDERL